MPAATPGSSGLSNHCSCTLRNPSGSRLDLGRLDHPVRVRRRTSRRGRTGSGRRRGSCRPRSPAFTVGPGRRQPGPDVRGVLGVRLVEQLGPRRLAGRARPRPSARSARPAPGSAIRPSPVAAQRRSAARPRSPRTARGRPRSHSAAGCQARRSRGSVLRSPPARPARPAGRSTQAQSWPSSSRARGAGGQVRPRRDVRVRRRARAAPRTCRPRRTPSRGMRSAAGRRHARGRQRHQPVRAELRRPALAGASSASRTATNGRPATSTGRGTVVTSADSATGTHCSSTAPDYGSRGPIAVPRSDVQLRLQAGGLRAAPRSPRARSPSSIARARSRPP